MRRRMISTSRLIWRRQGKYEDIIRLLMIKVANDAERPQWKTDSFFRRYAERSEELGIL